MKKTAIILGASGLTGGLLLNKLVQDDAYANIKVFLRSPLSHSSPKVKEFVGDMLNLNHFKDDFTAHEVFCCIGTTAAKTKDKELYKAIDKGIPEAAAQLCKRNNIPVFMVISALGANASSSIFYNRTKGQMEDAVLSQQIAHTYILRPSLIVGPRNENRMGELFGAWMMKILNPFMRGKLIKYRSIKSETIATAIHSLAKNKQVKGPVIESDVIEQIAADCKI